MPVLDDRIWQHPKWASLSDAAFRVGIAGLCYAHANVTHGYLSDGALRVIGANGDVRDELVTRHLWVTDRNGDGVRIHDWGDWNDDASLERKREQARERMRRLRARQRNGDAPSEPRDANVTRNPRARARGDKNKNDEREELSHGVTLGDADVEDEAARWRAWSARAEKPDVRSPKAFIKAGMDSGEWPDEYVEDPQSMRVNAPVTVEVCTECGCSPPYHAAGCSLDPNQEET